MGFNSAFKGLIKSSTLCVDCCEVCFGCCSPFRQFHSSDFTRQDDQTFQLVTLLNHTHISSPHPRKENFFLTWYCMCNIQCISLFEMLKFGINKRTGYPLESEHFHEFEAHGVGKVTISNGHMYPQKIFLVPRRLSRPQGHSRPKGLSK